MSTFRRGTTPRHDRACPVDDVVAHFSEIRGEGTISNELDGEALVWGLQSFAPRLKPLVALQNGS